MTALKLAIAGALLGWLIAKGHLDFGRLGRSAVAAPIPILVAFATVALNIALATVRWWLIVRGQAVDLSLLDALRLTMIGNFFNTAMPGAVGGDVFKMYYVLAHAPGRKVEAATTVALDRFVGLLSLHLLAALAVAVTALAGAGPDPARDRNAAAVKDHIRPFLIAVLVLVAVFAAVLVVALSPRLRRARPVAAVRERAPLRAVLARILKAVLLAARQPGRFAAAVLLSLGMHIFSTLTFFILGRLVLGESELGLGQYLYLVPVGLVFNGIPGPPGGLGIGEAGFAWLFAIALGTSVSPGAEMCLLWRAMLVLWNLVGGLVYIAHRREVAGATAEAAAKAKDDATAGAAAATPREST